MKADGTGVTRLVEHGGGAAWSPDGSRIAFHNDLAGSFDVYVMNADGTEVTRLTDDPGHDIDHAWSPDGTKLAVERSAKRDGGLFDAPDIYVTNADGTGPTRLTVSKVSTAGPPGRLIARRSRSRVIARGGPTSRSMS